MAILWREDGEVWWWQVQLWCGELKLEELWCGELQLPASLTTDRLVDWQPEHHNSYSLRLGVRDF